MRRSRGPARIERLGTRGLAVAARYDLLDPRLCSVQPRLACLAQLFAALVQIDALVERTRKGGGEIVGYLKTGSAYYAPAAAAVQMAEAIVKDKRRILPCAAWLEGEFGMSGIYLGVPCLLGENGLEQIIEVALDNDERAALETSARHVRSTVEALEALQ